MTDQINLRAREMLAVEYERSFEPERVSDIREFREDSRDTVAMRAIALALASVMPVPQWQPIEIAPMDGTEIALLFATEADLPSGRVGRVRAAKWIGDWSIPYLSDNPPIGWQPMPAAEN